MHILLLLFIIPLSLVVIWCAARMLQRMRKRKVYGRRLLTVKDTTSDMDLFFGIVFLIPIVRLIIIIIQEDFDPFIFIVSMWAIYLPMISIVKFTKAFSKVEIYEKGILARDRLWEWDAAENYSIKEDKKTVTFEFKLSRKSFKYGKITVLAKDKEKVENAISEVIQSM